MSTPNPQSPKASCRVIGEADHAAVAALLARGFPGRSAAFWRRGLDRQRARDLPPDVPRYGYLLESAGAVRGAVLLIYSVRRRADGTPALQCNLSSWFVDPAFRGYATLLTSIAQKNRDVTFVNLTPARNTWPIVEAQGFRTAGTGLFVSCPILSGRAAGPVEVVGPATAGQETAGQETAGHETARIVGLPDAERDLLASHAALGCLSLVCRTPEGPAPFILIPFRIRGGRMPLPAVRLIYARGHDEYRRCAGALGRFLLPRGRLFVLVGADGPIPGLAGLFTAQRGRRYVRGPYPPGLCDLTDSELVLFGV